MALNPLVLLFGRLVARSGRKRGNRQTDGRTDLQTKYCNVRNIITRQMLSIVASGSDANGFFHLALVIVRELSAVSAANLRCWLSESCLRRSSLSCAVSAANLRYWLAEGCLRRCSLSCAVSAANLRCWLAESCLRRCSLSCAVSAANLRCWLSESCLRRCSLSCAVSAANLRCWRCRRSCLWTFVVATRSWGGVYVIAGFTECSRRKLLARADDVRYIYISRHRGPAVRLGWLAPARQLSEVHL